jgi:hypothetical protein
MLLEAKLSAMNLDAILARLHDLGFKARLNGNSNPGGGATLIGLQLQRSREPLTLRHDGLCSRCAPACNAVRNHLHCDAHIY